MNRLFGMARGAYVNRHDADDMSDPRRIATQVAFLEAHSDVGIVGTGVQLIDADGQPLPGTYFPANLNNDAAQAELLQRNCLCQGSVLFRRELLDQVGVYEEGNLAEDYDLWLRMAEVTQLAVLDEVLYRYRIHASSLGHRRRYEQTYYTGRSLERALERRFGRPAPRARLWPAACLYVQAAVESAAAGNLEMARPWLQHGLALCPNVLAADEPVATMITDLVIKQPADAGEQFIRQVFSEVLPRTAQLSRLKTRLLSDLHFRYVFGASETRTTDEFDAHLWQGVGTNPAWLLNRGVRAMLARSVYRRCRAFITSTAH
jgi:hypothetical protein